MNDSTEWPEWKIRQDVFHRTHEGKHRDQKDLDDTKVIEYPFPDTSAAALIHDIVLHFLNDPDVLMYPAKSYFVAIIYSKLLCDHFGEEFYEVLNDKDLLYGNDPHFVPYKQAEHIYDSVLSMLKEYGGIDLNRGQCPDVRQYFIEEFMLG